MYIEKDINNIDLSMWREFVKGHPKSSVFQTPEMYEVYKQTPNYVPLIFMAIHENGSCIGILLACIISEGEGVIGKFSSRSIIQGGPLVKDDDLEICNRLLQEYNMYVSDKAVYTQIRNQYDNLSLNDAFQCNGYVFESHLNFIINTEYEDKTIWNKIGKSRKSHIKKAYSNGLIVECYANDKIDCNLITQGYLIIKEVYHNARLPLASIDLFMNMSKSGNLVLFVVKYNNIIIGCRFALAYNNILYGWYAGSYSLYYSKFPNDILIWETLKWAHYNNYKWFDYGGAGNPNKPYGVRKFKSQIGGDLVNFGRYECVHKEIKYKIGVLAYRIFKLYKSLFKK